MNKKQLLITAFTSLILLSLLMGTQFIRLAEANFMPVPIPQPAFTIQSDGSVNPPTAPIERNGEIYTLTDDIVGYTIVVECDNVVLDGDGYTLQGNGNSTGVFVANHNKITVRNMDIRNHLYGIRLITDVFFDEPTGYHIVFGNNITNNNYGIFLSYTSKNVLKNNQMNNNRASLYITYSALGDDGSSFDHSIDTSNTIDGKPVYYWINQKDKAVPLDAGYVALIDCKNILVQNLDLTNNSNGVMLVYTTNSTITRNNITGNGGHGIYLYKSSNNSISENSITNNSDHGIYLYKSSSNNISGNTITANDQDGIHLHDSSHNNINENIVSLNTEGIHVYSGGSDNRIVENTITENKEYGVSLDWADKYNVISENYISENGKGIFVKETTNNRIIGNMIKENNGWGIRLERGQRDNLICHNYFIDNKVGEYLQVSIPGLWEPGVWEPGNPNVWDDGEKGNYWSDYTTRYSNASEIEGTGIGDTPFVINPNNIDNYPVMQDNVVPEFPTWTPMLLTFAAVAVVLALYKQRLHKI